MCCCYHSRKTAKQLMICKCTLPPCMCSPLVNHKICYVNKSSAWHRIASFLLKAIFNRLAENVGTITGSTDTHGPVSSALDWHVVIDRRSSGVNACHAGFLAVLFWDDLALHVEGEVKTVLGVVAVGADYLSLVSTDGEVHGVAVLCQIPLQWQKSQTPHISIAEDERAWYSESLIRYKANMAIIC